MQSPLVSIIVPVYNAEKYLPQCLDSLINQTMGDIEILCINDCSTDSSLDILHKYAKKDNRIRILQNTKNSGAAFSKTKGIKESKGEYIGFVDADDWISKNYFTDLYNSVCGADICLTTNVYNVYDNNKHVKKYMCDDCCISENVQFRVNMLIASAIACNKIYKRTFILTNDISFININTRNEDLLFTCVALLKANRIMINNSSVYYYRQHNNSLSHKKSRIDDVIKILNSYDHVINIINKDKTILNYDKYLFIAGLRCRQYNDYKFCYDTETDKNKKILQKYFDIKIVNNVIVSLTSYPARIQTVDKTIKTLLNQSYKPSKVILWLASTQFPHKEHDLPKKLLALCEKGLTISWYKHDIKSYKKLIPTYKNFPDSIIVTADDDIVYSRDWLKLLVDSYVKHPFDINCHRCHQITFKHKNKIEKYNNWNFEYSVPSCSFNNFLTGGGGALYPPYCLYKDVLNEKKFMNLAPTADDVWFWAMGTLNNVKCRIIENCIPKITLSNASQEFALCKINTANDCLNDEQINAVFLEYPEILYKLKFIKQKKWLVHKIKKYFNIHIHHGSITLLKVFGITFINKHRV